MTVGPAALPLAAASRRLRRPGRPRKPGHVPGTSPSEAGGKIGQDRGALDSQSIAPRLLDLHQAADYLAVSVWTIRDLEAAGELRRVRLPLGARRDLRRLLFDRLDLDALIVRSRTGV